MDKSTKDSKRNSYWWITELPLTSKRVREILSNPVKSKELAKKIRTSRAKSNVVESAI